MLASNAENLRSASSRLSDIRHTYFHMPLFPFPPIATFVDHELIWIGAGFFYSLCAQQSPDLSWASRHQVNMYNNSVVQKNKGITVS